MANHKSAIKRNRQNTKRRERNRVIKTSVRTAIKKARTAIANGDSNTEQLVKDAEVLLAKAARKGVFHQNNASRKLSRLTSQASAAAK
ncbi:MAG: 30S ribosomal protein S20 [Deltaproteobacteria bacterium]|nr:30S ribosomal protein S20 [Deltaproteobacteria bacterium]